MEIKHYPWKKFNFFVLSIIMLFSLMPVNASETKKEITAISLKKVIELSKKGKKITTKLRNLGGITSIEGMVLDKKRKDVILYGFKEKGQPSILLDDFVVALNNSWYKYAEKKDNVIQYMTPGCTIDPYPNILKKIASIQSKILSSKTIKGQNKHYKEYKKVCEAKQGVKVLGIPANNHFAKVMVEADYHMKSIVDGSNTSQVDSLYSLPELYSTQIKAAIQEGNNPPAIRSMNRFWFNSGKMNYIKHNGVFKIKHAQVTLKTEQEQVSGEGVRSAAGSVDTMSQLFAYLFTDKFSTIKNEFPIYQKLENLFRLAFLSKLMRGLFDKRKLPLSLKPLFNKYKVKSAHVKNEVPGRPKLSKWEIPQGDRKWRIIAPTCGGVNMNIQPQIVDYESEEQLHMENIKEKILSGKRIESGVWTIII